jgi:small-conductance mechanosensitive channel
VQVLTGNLIKIALVCVALVIGLNTVGIDLTAFTVFSGAVGVGLGFGLQKIVSNFVSGIILLVERSIKPGDVIEVGSTFGSIIYLGARYASVRGRDGKEYLIPNENLITNEVVNWSYSNSLVRLDAEFGVAYSSDLHAVRDLAVEVANATARVLASPRPVCPCNGLWRQCRRPAASLLDRRSTKRRNQHQGRCSARSVGRIPRAPDRNPVPAA